MILNKKLKNKISVIIPAYFKEKITLNTISSLLKISKEIELIIVYKWEKFDYFNEEIKKFWINIKIILPVTESNRANFMNLWAEKSSWEILIFLHNDTVLPENYFDILSNLYLSEYNYWWFYKKFYPNNLLLKINSFWWNFRLNTFWSLLWDNSIFVSKDLFDKIWWFPKIGLMEDVEISKKLKRYWKRKVIKDFNITSSKKFLKNWTLKTLFFMAYIRFLYLIWTDTEVLKKKYSEL